MAVEPKQTPHTDGLSGTIPRARSALPRQATTDAFYATTNGESETNANPLTRLFGAANSDKTQSIKRISQDDKLMDGTDFGDVALLKK